MAIEKPVLTRDSSSPSQRPQQQALPTHSTTREHWPIPYDTVATTSRRCTNGQQRKCSWLRSLTLPESIRCCPSRASSSPDDAAAPISLAAESIGCDGRASAITQLFSIGKARIPSISPRSEPHHYVYQRGGLCFKQVPRRGPARRASSRHARARGPPPRAAGHNMIHRAGVRK